MILCAYWLAIIIVGLAIVFQLSAVYEVDTRRKVFHFMMVAMLLPATYVDPTFAALALSLMLAIFLLLDLFRASQLPPLSKSLAYFLTPYVDGRDLKGPVVISHIFLLIGCAIPLWLSHIFDILTAIFLCIYFMLEGEAAYSFFLSLFPTSQRNRLNITLKKAELKISKWLFGQGTLMLILGVTSTIVFGLLKVRYFVLLGFLMGLFNIIPIAGGVITIVVACSICDGPPTRSTIPTSASTIRSFFEANLDVTSELPRFNFFDMSAPVFSRLRFLPGCGLRFCQLEHSARIAVDLRRLLQKLYGVLRSTLRQPHPGQILERTWVMRKQSLRHIKSLSRSVDLA